MAFFLQTMEQQEITQETLERVKSMPRIDFSIYQELILQKQVIRLLKIKRPRTIFVDDEKGEFYYLNPIWKQLHLCGKFVEVEVSNG